MMDPLNLLTHRINAILVTYDNMPEHSVGVEEDNWSITRNVKGYVQLMYHVGSLTLAIDLDHNNPLKSGGCIIDQSTELITEVDSKNMADMARFVLDGMFSEVA